LIICSNNQAFGALLICRLAVISSHLIGAQALYCQSSCFPSFEHGSTQENLLAPSTVLGSKSNFCHWSLCMTIFYGDVEVSGEILLNIFKMFVVNYIGFSVTFCLFW